MGCGITGFHILFPQSLHFCYAFLWSFTSLSSYSLFTHEALCPGIPTTFHVHFTCILLPCLWSIHTLSSVFICKCIHSPCVGGIDEDETRCLIWLSMSRFFWASSTLLSTGTPNIVPKTHSSVRPPIRSFSTLFLMFSSLSGLSEHGLPGFSCSSLPTQPSTSYHLDSASSHSRNCFLKGHQRQKHQPDGISSLSSSRLSARSDIDDCLSCLTSFLSQQHVLPGSFLSHKGSFYLCWKDGHGK